MTTASSPSAPNEIVFPPQWQDLSSWDVRRLLLLGLGVLRDRGGLRALSCYLKARGEGTELLNRITFAPLTGQPGAKE